MDEHTIAIWKTAIETQIHFNDLIMKIRATITSLIMAIFGAAAFSLRETKLYYQFLNRDVHISAIIILVGLGFLCAYFLLDYLYYFRLLIGAVKFTSQLDQKHKELGLTSSIIKASPGYLAHFALLSYYTIIFLIGILVVIFIVTRPIKIG